MAEDTLEKRPGWPAAVAGPGTGAGFGPGIGVGIDDGVDADPARGIRGLAKARPRSAPAADGAGAAQGGVRLLLRVEGAALLVFAMLAYAQLAPGQWGRFAALLLLPDLAMLGYLAGPAIGARAYNAAHSVVGPVLLASAGFALPAQAALLWPLAAIWLAHIGLDRLLGYGLKYGQGFGHTHLGRLGPRDPW